MSDDDLARLVWCGLVGVACSVLVGLALRLTGRL